MKCTFSFAILIYSLRRLGSSSGGVAELRRLAARSCPHSCFVRGNNWVTTAEAPSTATFTPTIYGAASHVALTTAYVFESCAPV